MTSSFTGVKVMAKVAISKVRGARRGARRARNRARRLAGSSGPQDTADGSN